MIKKITTYILLATYLTLWSGSIQAVTLSTLSDDHAVHVDQSYGKQQIILHSEAVDHDHSHEADEHKAHFDNSVFDHPDHSLPDIQHDDSNVKSFVDNCNKKADCPSSVIPLFFSGEVNFTDNLVVSLFPQPPPFCTKISTLSQRRTLVLQV